MSKVIVGGKGSACFQEPLSFRERLKQERKKAATEKTRSNDSAIG